MIWQKWRKKLRKYLFLHGVCVGESDLLVFLSGIESGVVILGGPGVRGRNESQFI